MTMYMPTVTVSIPSYNGGRALIRAITSILNQSYDNLRLVVVDDNSETDPSYELAQFRDDKRFTYVRAPRNLGYYAVHQSVLEECETEYFAVQDADDWSEPNRIQLLLECAHIERHVAVYSGHWRHAAGKIRERNYIGMIKRQLGPRLDAHGLHHGLYDTKSLRAIGGYSGAYRVSYDMIVVALVKMWGTVGYVDCPLYNRVQTEGSLTQSPLTGLNSPYRRDINKRLEKLYVNCYQEWLRFDCNEIQRSEMSLRFQNLTKCDLKNVERKAMDEVIRRIRRA